MKKIYTFVIAIGVIATYLCYFPGLVVNDSSDQFRQALTFHFRDWHPPVMAFIWSLTNRIIPGPNGFFILQIALYWAGFLLIGWWLIDGWQDSPRRYARFVLLCLLPFSPFLFNICGTIWKDILVFGCFGLALGLIVSRPAGSRIWSWRSAIIWLLLIIGSLARYNSIVGAVPLLVLHLWPQPPTRAPLRAVMVRGIVATGLIIVAVLGVRTALDGLLHPTKGYIVNSIFLFDLVGISHRIDHNLVPGRWSPDEARQIVTNCYTPEAWNPVSPYGNCHFVYDRLVQSGAWQHGLLAIWARAVAEHPRAYLAHRLDYLHTLFWPETVFAWDPNPESFQFGFTKNLMFRSVGAVMTFVKFHFPLYLVLTDGFWIFWSSVLCAFLFALYLADPRRYYSGWLVSLSAAFYSVPLLIVGQAGDYRYVYWTAGATCIAALSTPRRPVERGRVAVGSASSTPS